MGVTVRLLRCAAVAGGNRDRQRAERTATRVAAAEIARHKATARRRNIAIGAIGLAVLVVFLGIVLFGATRDGDDTNVATGSSTSSVPTSAPAESAAGKPCVALSDPLPPGSPAVPITIGPPPTALVKEDLVVGTGATVNPDDTVTANYIGVSCSTGKIFDSSYSRGQPSEFPLSNVIPGWTDGLPGMQIGGQRLLGIPPDLAYGTDGAPPDILPDETLWFVVEVVATGPTTPTTAPTN